MISKENRKKHGDLVKYTDGHFGKNEVAIYGTTCEEVALIVGRMRMFFPEADIAFVDADHETSHNELVGTHWQNKINAVQLTSKLFDNDYQHRISLSQSDAIVVNGNHFKARKQIVVCNPDKENSLRKRKDQLTNVIAFLSLDKDTLLPQYVSELVENSERVPVISLSDDTGIQELFASFFLCPAPLRALIMAGGRSIRMGQDKSRMNYHGEEQFLYLKHLLDKLRIPNCISCRADQKDYFESHNCDVVVDRLSDMGPLGGIISAFMGEPGHALMVLACDLPLLDETVLLELMKARSVFHFATSFESPHDRFPEPLIAIWEPKAYPIAMQFIAQGYSCPRKVLINSNTCIIKSANPEKLVNVNTMDDLKEVLEK